MWFIPSINWMEDFQNENKIRFECNGLQAARDWKHSLLSFMSHWRSARQEHFFPCLSQHFTTFLRVSSSAEGPTISAWTSTAATEQRDSKWLSPTYTHDGDMSACKPHVHMSAHTTLTWHQVCMLATCDTKFCPQSRLPPCINRHIRLDEGFCQHLLLD